MSSNNVVNSPASPGSSTTGVRLSTLGNSGERKSKKGIHPKRASSSTSCLSQVLSKCKCGIEKREMTLEERLTLGWWEKLRRFGKIPWKLLVHIALVALTSAQIGLYVEREVPYLAATRATFFNLFYGPNFDNSDGSRQMYIYTIREAAALINNTIYTFFNINNISVGYWDYTSPQDPHIMLSVTSYKEGLSIFKQDGNPSLATHTKKHKLTRDDPYGPLAELLNDTSALAKFLELLSSMTFDLTLINADFSYNVQLIHEWDISINYDFSIGGGQMVATLNAVDNIREDITNFGPLIDKGYLWLDFVIIFLAVASLILSLKSITQTFYTVQIEKTEITKHSTSNASTTTDATPQTPTESSDSEKQVVRWQAVPLAHKVRLFNRWFILSLSANIINIVSSTLDVLDKVGLLGAYDMPIRILVGTGCAFNWFNLIRYLESFRMYYVLVQALRDGMPNVARLVVSALPIMLGYTFFGMIMFGDVSTNFNSLGHAFNALFATFNGDDLYARYIVLSNQGTLMAFVSRIYEYTFICIAAYAIVNIFIAIIVDAYNVSVRENQSPSMQKLMEQQSGEGEVDVTSSAWGGVLEMNALKKRKKKKRAKEKQRDTSRRGLFVNQEADDIGLAVDLEANESEPLIQREQEESESEEDEEEEEGGNAGEEDKEEPVKGEREQEEAAATTISTTTTTTMPDTVVLLLQIQQQLARLNERVDSIEALYKK